ncbi:hypothetical protein V6N13_107488 [Hibiscus sabdariffa]|uniref:Uncharacterized protein n=1 Tax=Hibiscus sabdariffa TaxID=183260 RepID=A0ABR2SPH4_9ROSI
MSQRLTPPTVEGENLDSFGNRDDLWVIGDSDRERETGNVSFSLSSNISYILDLGDFSGAIYNFDSKVLVESWKTLTSALDTRGSHAGSPDVIDDGLRIHAYNNALPLIYSAKNSFQARHQTRIRQFP